MLSTCITSQQQTPVNEHNQLILKLEFNYSIIIIVVWLRANNFNTERNKLFNKIHKTQDRHSNA